MNKRAVSPLIATVLLVAFSVMIGVIVMTWGKNFTKQQVDAVDAESSKQMQCSMNLEIVFVELDGEELACYDSTGVSLTLLNKGTVNITGIKVQVVAINNSIENSAEVSVMLMPSQAEKVNIPNFGMDGVRHISIIPRVYYPGSSAGILCTNKALELDDLNEC